MTATAMSIFRLHNPSNSNQRYWICQVYKLYHTTMDGTFIIAMLGDDLRSCNISVISAKHHANHCISCIGDPERR